MFSNSRVFIYLFIWNKHQSGAAAIAAFSREMLCASLVYLKQVYFFFFQRRSHLKRKLKNPIKCCCVGDFGDLNGNKHQQVLTWLKSQTVRLSRATLNRCVSNPEINDRQAGRLIDWPQSCNLSQKVNTQTPPRPEKKRTKKCALYLIQGSKRRVRGEVSVAERVRALNVSTGRKEGLVICW